MALIVTALFTQSSYQPATGLTLTDIDLYLYRRAKADGSVTTLWNGENPTEEVGGGLYSKSYADYDPSLYDYYGYAEYTGSTTLNCNYAYSLIYATSETTSVASAAITIHRGDSLELEITGLGALTSRSKLWFTVKHETGQVDAAAMVQIEETAGLVYINAAAAETAANGSITVDDPAAGDITVALDEAETAKLPPTTSAVYDVQMLTSGGDVDTLSSGACSVTADVTRAVA